MAGKTKGGIMPNYYDIPEEDRNRIGLDYDLVSCLEYNPQPDIPIDAITQVLAVYEGANDESDWRWIIALKDGRFAFLQGGCDYTGWDCQSWASNALEDTPEKAAHHALGDLRFGKSTPLDAGLGHLISLATGGYGQDNQSVYNALIAQLKQGKSQTWREQKDDKFGF